VIAKLLPGLAAGGEPPDLTPVVTELACLCESLKAIAALPPLDLAPLVTAIEDLKAATAAGDQAIVDALTSTPTLPPDPRAKVAAFAQYLVDNYAFDAGEAQIVQE
jgi:hypothetical protein